MLQSSSLSKVYGHGHIKKFWLMQNQKELEGKALTASSSASPSRHGSSSSGLGHESKQGPQFCLGNVTTRSLSSPSGISVRSSASGPACFNMALARHASLVTCAESLSPPVRTDQPRSLIRPLSPSISASSSKEGNPLAEDYDGPTSLSSPCGGDEVSAFASQCESTFDVANHSAGDAFYSIPPMSKLVFGNSIHDCFSRSENVGQDSTCLQERFDHVETSNNVDCKRLNIEPYRCSMDFFSNYDSSRPFAAPFQPPEMYFLKVEGAADEYLDRNPLDKSGSSFASLVLDHGPVKRELVENKSSNACEGSKDLHHVGVSGVRTCSVCGTSKTPLWRSGPRGPKSLCNACGIRFKKAKRISGEGSTSPLPSPHSIKNLLKPAKRKQDTPPSNSEAQVMRPLVIGAPMSGTVSQVSKKRRWSKLMKKGECVAQKCEVTGSSGESSLTWNLHSPAAISSPSVAQFERLSIEEYATASDMVTGKDEEEAAMLLMYMSSGLAFA